MALDDLFKSLSLFTDGIQQLAITSGINEATQHVDQIRNSQLTEMQKRAQQQQVASQLAMRLTGAGANAQQVAQAAGAITPPQIKSAQDAFLQGKMTGSNELIGIGQQALTEENRPKLEQQQDQQDFLAEQYDLNRKSNEKIAGIRADGKKGGMRGITTSQEEKITKFDNSLTQMATLLDEFDTMKGDIGPWAGRDIIKSWRDPKFADFKAKVGRYYDQYKLAVTGMGSGVKENDAIRKNVLDVTETPEAFETKLKTLIKEGVTFRQQKLNNMAKAKWDVSGFEDDGTYSSLLERVSSGALPSESQPAGPKIQTAKVNGQLVQGYLDEGGNFIPLQTPKTPANPGVMTFEPFKKPQ